MTMARRGIFGMLAALPFVGKAAAAVAQPPTEGVTVALSFEQFEARMWRNLALDLQDDLYREMPLSGGTATPRNLMAASSDIAQDRFEIAIPWGWDTLENVR